MTFFARFWGHLRAIKLSHVTNGTVPYSYTSTEIIYKKIIGHTGVLELLYLMIGDVIDDVIKG